MTHQPDSIAVALTEAAQAIHSPRSLPATLDAIVSAAQGTVPGLEHVGISIVHRKGKIETLAGTGPLVWELDDLQYTTGQGPCIESLRGESLIVLEHAAKDARWPDYLPKAVERGLRSQLAVRLYDEDETVGGLNLYSTESDTIDPGAVHLAELFATHATIALGRARQEDRLNEALATRKVIGQAIGIIAERYKITDDRAFHFLVRASTTSNIRLRDIAEEVVDTANAQYGESSGSQGSAP